MPDLEKQISEWRRQMVAAGITSPALLDEFESHLREELEQQKQRGLNDQQALKVAMEKIGPAAALKDEFGKIRRMSPLQHRLMISIGIALVGFTVLLSAFTVMMCYETLGDRVTALLALTCILVVACGWTYALPFLPVIQSAPRRIGVGLACILSGFIIATLFCQIILPIFGRADHMLPAIGVWTVFLIAIFFCAGLGLMMDENARRGIKARPL